MTDLNRRKFLGTTGALIAGHTMVDKLSAKSSNDTINIGCIGVGGRGTSLLRSLLTVKGHTVRAICDINADHIKRAQKLVTEAGQAKPDGIDDWKKLLERKDIDAVVSALPCYLHAANYLDVIAAGKDLYGEKPMCITPEDCDAVVAAANKSKQIVQIGFQRRSDPRFIETMKQVHAGELGPLVEGRIIWSNSWGPLYGWFGQREKSGDWMVEQAVHNWDVMNWANQCRPARAVGFGRGDLFREKQPERNVHDYYSAVVEYENGVIVNIIHSWVPPTKFNEEFTRLIGTNAGIDFNSGTFSYRPRFKKKDRVGYTDQGKFNSTTLALENFLKSVRSRKQPVATVEHGRDGVLAGLLVREAVYTKKAVEMKTLSA